MSDAPDDYRKYLDPKTLAKVGHLDITARLVVEGFIQGLHRSPFHGFSVEFAQHREYCPGDDIRHIDWKVYSKTDRHYIKQHEQETNLKAHILLDCSESMRYRRTGLSKYDYGCYLAAALAHMLIRQQDQVGLTLFDSEVRKIIPPSAGPNQIKTLIREMSAARPVAKTDVEPVFHKMAEEFSRKGFVIVISDLFVPREGLFRGLRHFRHKRHEVMVFHLMDDDEINFDLDGMLLFKGLEKLGELRIQPRLLRDAYRQVVEKYLTEVRRECVANRIDYRLVNTAQTLDLALSAFLAQREAYRRSAAARRL
jgi:uncharacterized protein (DUF58 family)